MKQNFYSSKTGAILRQDLLRELQVRYRDAYGRTLSQKSLSFLLECFFDTIRESIQSGKSVKLPGFGTFYRNKAPHWNCQYDVIEFRMSKSFRRIGFLKKEDPLL